MTEYFTKEEVLGVIQAGINSYDDLLKRDLKERGNYFSVENLSLKLRKAELEDLLIQFKNRRPTNP